MSSVSPFSNSDRVCCFVVDNVFHIDAISPCYLMETVSTSGRSLFKALSELLCVSSSTEPPNHAVTRYAAGRVGAAATHAAAEVFVIAKNHVGVLKSTKHIGQSEKLNPDTSNSLSEIYKTRNILLQQHTVLDEGVFQIMDHIAGLDAAQQHELLVGLVHRGKWNAAIGLYESGAIAPFV